MLSEDGAMWFTIGLGVVVALIYAAHGWWIFFQVCIFVAVLFSNIYFKWTDNGFAAGLLGMAVAFVVTFVIFLFRSPRRRERLAIRPLSRDCPYNDAGRQIHPPPAPRRMQRQIGQKPH
jgi:uncharacterized membrane protein YccC